MKMLPVQLSLNPPLGLWSDVLWRCPPAPPSQLAELKTQLPPSLPLDPRLWGREDVTVFLRFCEREFDLPKVDHDLFQMNGKALCLLTRSDFGHRCPGAGDVLHNVLQMLIIESHMMQWHLPNSPVTPTSRYPLSPHSHPPTPTWPPIAPPESPFHNTHMHHFMAPNSVTLSPPPSVDSQASSPPQSQDQNTLSASTSGSGSGSGSGSSSSSSSNNSSNSNNNGNGTASMSGSGSSNGTSNSSSGSSIASVPASAGCSGNLFVVSKFKTSTSSNHSDSDEDSYSENVASSSMAVARTNATVAAVAAAAAAAQYSASPPNTPILKDIKPSLSQHITNSFVNSWQQSQAQQTLDQKLYLGNGNGGSVSAPTTPSYMQPTKREFFPENSEPNTNGRLLWDFLQQLLNDRNQKYSDLIAWKCRDTGVFKIVDPAGLAKLWGIQKNHLSMNYDKMSRALRYYYRVNILRKVQGERHCYQFLRNPTELKNIKNISLLRHSIANTPSSVVNSASGATAGTVATNATQAGNNQANVAVGGCSTTTGWSLPQQSMSSSLQQVAAHQQQQQTPQRPSSRNHLNLPPISPSAAAAAVAAAAAAAYGPPPTSPLFMHAINGAFHYLSTNAGPPPNSPALPSTPSEKFQFSALKLENTCQDNVDEMKPTDLSLSAATNNSDKRPYSSPSANEDCYPLIRNADGLTTIKLIRYNDNETPKPALSSSTATEHYAPVSPKQHSSIGSQQADAVSEKHTNCNAMSMSMAMDNSNSNSTEATSTSLQYGSNLSMLPTDLRK